MTLDDYIRWLREYDPDKHEIVNCGNNHSVYNQNIEFFEYDYFKTDRLIIRPKADRNYIIPDEVKKLAAEITPEFDLRIAEAIKKTGLPIPDHIREATKKVPVVKDHLTTETCEWILDKKVGRMQNVRTACGELMTYFEPMARAEDQTECMCGKKVVVKAKEPEVCEWKWLETSNWAGYETSCDRSSKEVLEHCYNCKKKVFIAEPEPKPKKTRPMEFKELRELVVQGNWFHARGKWWLLDKIDDVEQRIGGIDVEDALAAYRGYSPSASLADMKKLEVEE